MMGNKYKEEIARLESELSTSRKELSDLRAEKELIEEQRNGLVHERDELKEWCERGEKKRRYIEEQRNALAHEIKELCEQGVNSKENYDENLERENKELYNDYVRVTEAYNRMAYNASTLDRLHEDVVLRRWNNDTHLQEFTCTMPFEFLDIFSVNAVVVVFPLVPVIATTAPFVN